MARLVKMVCKAAAVDLVRCLALLLDKQFDYQSWPAYLKIVPCLRSDVLEAIVKIRAHLLFVAGACSQP